MATQRPSVSRGQYYDYLVPCNGPYNAQMHWYSSGNWKALGRGATDTTFFDGLLSQNNPAVKLLAFDGTTSQQLYYEDPDGVCRRATGGYVPVGGSPSGRGTNTLIPTGLPMVTSGSTFNGGVVIPGAQSESRSIILHRPFRSVAEMSYSFRGTPWKNLDFFTPESGDTALLDTFCVNEPPADSIVAGKVSLNTRQAPVLKAVFVGAYRDELANLPSPPASGTLPPLSANEAKNLADTFLGLTSGTTAWKGPLRNIADLVGHYVTGVGAVFASDVYQYVSPSIPARYTFSGFSAALSGVTPAGAPIWDLSPSTLSPSSQYIQRFRESAIRPLAAVGQTRVWNLLVDVVAQVGNYPANAQTLGDFDVQGETRYWLHVAIDRLTGQVIDQSLELVPTGPTKIQINPATVLERQPANSSAGGLDAIDSTPGSTFTFTLVSGAGDSDNASFVISGNTLKTTAVFDYLTKNTYNVRLRATDQDGLAFEQPYLIAVQASPYTQWKVTNFGSQAADPSIAGDTANPAGDGIGNLLKYALSLDPSKPGGTGITSAFVDGQLVMNYTRAAVASDISVHAYWSNDLANWQSDGVTETMLTNDGTTQQWQALAPLASPPGKIFLRLQVTRP